MRRLLLTLLLLGSGLAHAAELPETDWLELMPKSDQKALEQMPEISHNSPEANGTFTAKGGLKQAKGLPAVMYSTKTVAAMNGKDIRIGGYPVPLETDAKGRSTLFFLVPYPGACIHVPPPPPNQLVLVRYPKGLKLDDIYTPLWVVGTLKIEKVNNDLADAAYRCEGIGSVGCRSVRSLLAAPRTAANQATPYQARRRLPMVTPSA